MFTVRMRAAAEAAQNLQQFAGRLNQQIDDVETIVSRLRRISEYDQVRHVLRVQLENMRTEKYRMLEMMAALNEIQRMYQLAENHITEYGEQIHQINRNHSMKVIDLDNIREAIQVYHIK